MLIGRNLAYTLPHAAHHCQRGELGVQTVVKMIHENFIPLLTHNNKPGRDAEALEAFLIPAAAT